MQLPKQLPACRERTLLFVADGMRAKWYVVADRTMEKAGSFVRPKPEFRGKEGMGKISPATNTHSGASHIENILRHEEHAYCKEAGRQLEAALKTSKAARALVATPHHLKHLIDKSLGADTRKKIAHWHNGNLYRFSGIQIASLLLPLPGHKDKL